MANSIRRTCIATLLAFGAALALAPGAQAATEDRIIVSGASGQLGGLTVKALLAKGVPAKNLILVSRTPDALAEYAKMGAATRFGDFSKPESLPAAYAGGTRMLLISIGGGAGPRPQAHQRAIDAAIKAGVKQIAYTSWIAISKGDTTGLSMDHLATEEILKKSGVAYTILRNSIYMDGLVSQAAKVYSDGRVTVPASENKFGYVTREDCAAAAAAVLTTPGHDNKIYDITGPELVGQHEIADAVTAVTGKKIEVVPADPNAPPPRSFGGPSLSVTSTAVADLTGRPAQSLRMLLAANKTKVTGGK
jgi:NAD(P)H dehydrogenase (quinone)